MERGHDDIWVWRYELRSATALNSVSARTGHPGALIRRGAGFGCLHPWPELGDPPLDDQLAALAAGVPTPLARRSLACASADGKAREEGRPLLPGGRLPRSHWLLREGDRGERIREQGFTSAKVKVGRDLAGERERILRLADAGLRIRLDANESLSRGIFQEWWNSFPPEVRSRIDLVEDPVPWHEADWMRLAASGVPLAADRHAETRLGPCRWAVWKPAVSDGRALQKWAGKGGRGLIVTSYMDHPLGQMWAAVGAAGLADRNPEVLGDCGLLTHLCFAENAFSERLVTEGPCLLPVEGTGLGFDDLLEELPWKRLT